MKFVESSECSVYSNLFQTYTFTTCLLISINFTFHFYP